MKTKLLILLMLFLSAGAKASIVQEEDKNLHMGVSYNLTATGTYTLQKMGFSHLSSSAMSGGMVLLVGVLKEYVHDSRPDQQDIKADAIGTTLGMVIPLRYEF